VTRRPCSRRTSLGWSVGSAVIASRLALFLERVKKEVVDAVPLSDLWEEAGSVAGAAAVP